MDFLVFLVSRKALRSRWVQRELEFAARREIEEKQILILPFLIDSTQSAELPWYVQHLRCERVAPDDRGITALIGLIKERAARRLRHSKQKTFGRRSVKREPALEKIIGDVELGQWKKATTAALEILKHTDSAGRNPLFEALFEYQDLRDNENLFWSATGFPDPEGYSAQRQEPVQPGARTSVRSDQTAADLVAFVPSHPCDTPAQMANLSRPPRLCSGIQISRQRLTCTPTPSPTRRGTP